MNRSSFISCSLTVPREAAESMKAGPQVQWSNAPLPCWVVCEWIQTLVSRLFLEPRGRGDDPDTCATVQSRQQKKTRASQHLPSARASFKLVSSHFQRTLLSHMLISSGCPCIQFGSPGHQRHLAGRFQHANSTPLALTCASCN